MVMVKQAEELRASLRRIDGRGYKAYKDLAGAYRFPNFTLFCDYIQGDPFASPSRMRVRVAQSQAAFPADLYATRVRRVALQDFLARAVARAIETTVKGNRGTGKSGLVAIDRPGQQVLERTAVLVTADFVEARLSVGLPAAGRTVLAREAEEIFFQELPQLVERALLYRNLEAKAVRAHVALAEDQESIRGQLRQRGLVAFVGNGSILPRASGVSDRPLARERAVAFQSPPSLEVSFSTPNAGEIKGMGIPQGVTLIVGGGYHGKSTLLRALERGVYNHIRGDGREWVITDADAVKIRAEDGRRVARVDISPFISNLPFGQETTAFSTEDASGSTSQAANIIEALETGAKVLLIDEDTSATNFMIRDRRMQRLVAKEKEPITPFIDKVEQLRRDFGVSTVLVVGGSGDYFDVADTVIMMDEYRPRDVTQEAKAIAAEFATERQREGGEHFGSLTARVPLPAGIDPTRGPRGKVKIGARGVDEIRFGYQEIDLGAIEQIVDPSQTRAIGDLLYYATKFMDGHRSLAQVVDLVMEALARQGLEILAAHPGEHPGDYALPRRHEVAAALNRLRTLRIKA